jgi:hypothetical protein
VVGSLSKDGKYFLRKRIAPGVRVKVSLVGRSHTCNRGGHKICSLEECAVELVIRVSCQIPVLQKMSQPGDVSKDDRSCFVCWKE